MLDWEKCDLKYQTGYSDIILSKLSYKYLVLEAKKPGSFGQQADMDEAIAQARRYADQQNIPCIAVSDGKYLYVADCCNGGLKDRLFIDLSASAPPAEALWRLSVYGINRSYDESITTVLVPKAVEHLEQASLNIADVMLHPKYKLPVQCFAYAPHAHLPKTWKLPYRLSCGKPVESNGRIGNHLRDIELLNTLRLHLCNPGVGVTLIPPLSLLATTVARNSP